MNKIDLINSWSSSTRTSLTSELQNIIEGKYPKDLDIDFRITPDYFSFYAEVIDNLNNPQKDNVISILNNLLGSYSTYEKISSEKQRLNDFRISSIFNLVKYINTDNNEYISSSILKTIISDYLTFSEEIYLHAAFTLSTYNVSSKEKKQYWLELGENPVFFVPTFNALSDLPDDCLDYLLDYFKKTEQLSLTDFEKFENILETTCIHLTEKILLFCGEEEKKFIFYLRKIFRVQNFLKGKIISFLKFYLETVNSELLHYLNAYEVYYEFVKGSYYIDHPIDCNIITPINEKEPTYYDVDIFPGFPNHLNLWKLFGFFSKKSPEESSLLSIKTTSDFNYLGLPKYLEKHTSEFSFIPKRFRDNSNNFLAGIYPLEGLKEVLLNSTDIGIQNRFYYPILGNKTIEDLEKEIDVNKTFEKFKYLIADNPIHFGDSEAKKVRNNATYKLWVLLNFLQKNNLAIYVNDNSVEDTFTKLIPHLVEYFNNIGVLEEKEIKIINIDSAVFRQFNPRMKSTQKWMFESYQLSNAFFFVGTAPLLTEILTQDHDHYLFSVSEIYSSFSNHDEETHLKAQKLEAAAQDKLIEENFRPTKTNILNHIANSYLHQCLNININLTEEKNKIKKRNIVYRLFKLVYFLSTSIENDPKYEDAYLNFILANYQLYSVRNDGKKPTKHKLKESISKCFKFGIATYIPNRFEGSNSWDIYEYLIEEKSKMLKTIKIDADKINGIKHQFAKALALTLEFELGRDSVEYLLLDIVPSEIKDFFYDQVGFPEGTTTNSESTVLNAANGNTTKRNIS